VNDQSGKQLRNLPDRKRLYQFTHHAECEQQHVLRFNITELVQGSNGKLVSLSGWQSTVDRLLSVRQAPVTACGAARRCSESLT
jgi:hypothetical protein